jgi:hypothetical protein
MQEKNGTAAQGPPQLLPGEERHFPAWKQELARRIENLVRRRNRRQAAMQARRRRGEGQ